jgi:hypothetical protein
LFCEKTTYTCKYALIQPLYQLAQTKQAAAFALAAAC